MSTCFRSRSRFDSSEFVFLPINPAEMMQVPKTLGQRQLEIVDRILNTMHQGFQVA